MPCASICVAPDRISARKPRYAVGADQRRNRETCGLDLFAAPRIISRRAGRCHIGRLVMIGAGATVIDRIRICDNVVIGAGTTVVRDIIEPGTYVGTPARRLPAQD